jgi:eukaryotic-like serine/threonine-protein kinase
MGRGRSGVNPTSQNSVNHGPAAMVGAAMVSAVRQLPADLEPRRSHRCGVCGGAYPVGYRVCPQDGTALTAGPAPADPLVGTVLGGAFRILQPLARGGMGRVYEAEHLRVPRRFAVKVLSEAYADRPELVTRFEREARALAPLSCPHVVDVVDVLRAVDGRPCIVTGLLTGEDLARRIAREGPLPVREALEIARQMCRGLDAAHAHGVVHRDLKPSNVFLASTPDGHVTVKLVDFGVAKLLFDPEVTRSDAVVGTPAYMAPEQARAATAATEASDVYGVGAVLYHMLSGQPPYPCADATEVLARVLAEEPPRLRSVAPQVPEAVEAVVQAAMARDAGARVATAAELQGLMAGLIPTAPGPDGTPAPGPAETRHGPSPEGDTQVLRAGIVGEPLGLTRRAGRARGLGVAAAGGLVVGAGLAAAVGMAALLAGLDVAPGSRAQAWLVGVATWAAAVAAGVYAVRRLRDAWRSAIAVEGLRRRWGAGLAAAMGVAGCALVLLAGGVVLRGGAPGLGPAPLGVAVLLAVAVGATVGRRPPGRIP